MSEERRYYIENAITEDKWLIYDDAHRYGCTRSKPEILTFYTSNVSPVVVRRDVDTDTLFDTSIPLPHDWVNDLSDFESPLYKKIGDITLYMGENPSIYTGYTTSKNSTVATLVENTSHDGYISIKDGSDSLYELYGITDHKCDNYYVQEGAVLVWYDSVEHLYWDNRPNKKIWVPEPPQIEVDTTSNSILPNPIPLDPIDCFSDIAEPIILGSLKSYRYYTAGKDWTSGKELEPIDFSPDFDFVDKVYVDLLSLNGFLYVINENGADFQSVHYDYADAIPADKFVAMVEPEGYDTFYKVQDLVIDLPYLVDPYSNEKYYWVESEGQYFTELGLESVGYYTSPIPPELFEFTNILLTCPLETYTLEEPNQSILPLGVQLLEYPPLIPDQPVQEYTYFGGDFSGNNIDITTVNGGGNLIDRHNISRDLIQLSGYESGSTIDRYNQSRSTFSLIGWTPGGMFELPEPIVLSYTLGGVLSSSSDDEIELLTPEMMEIHNIDLARSLTTDTVSVASLITNRLESDGIELTRALSSNVVPIENITGIQTALPLVQRVYTQTSSSGSIVVSTGGSASIYYNGTNDPVEYDSSKTYAVSVGSGHGEKYKWQFTCIDVNGYVEIKNNLIHSVYALGENLYICSSNQAEVVHVFDSNDKLYQAFRCTYNGVAYYYVIDGVHFSWIDSLSTIGYRLVECYLDNSTFNIKNYTLNNWQSRGVYNIDGTYYNHDPGYVVTSTYYISSNDELVKHPDNVKSNFMFIKNSDVLYLRNYNNNAADSGYNIALVEFERLEANKAYLDQYSHSSNQSLAYNQNTLLYDEDGNLIPYYASDKYILTCCSSYNGTISNERVRPVNMNGSLGYICSNTGTACWIYYTLKRSIPNVTVSYPLTVPEDPYYALSVSPNSSTKLYDVELYVSSSVIPYDSSNIYHTIVGNGSSTTYYIEFETVNIDGDIGIKNISESSLYTFGCTLYESDSLSTDVIDVIKSSDNLNYKSFKYTESNVDYYYVLDGVQTRWTDDLSSIGYTEEQPFVSDRFIDVTSEALALSPAPNYTPNGYFWIDNLSGRMPLSAYTTDTTQDYDYITWGYDDFASSSINQSEIPTIIWLNAEWQYAPDAEVIESLGLTNEVNNAPEGSVILRVINEISGNTLGGLTFGNITRVEFIKIFYSDMVAYNYFGDGNQSISVWETSFDYDTMLHEGLPEVSFSSNGVTDTVTVPLSDCFLVKNNKVSYCAFKTLIPANTVHINGSLYDKPLVVEYGENTGVVVYEPTTYDL